MNNIKHNAFSSSSLTVNTPTLMKILNCGRFTAEKIGNNAKAKVRIGRRVLWNLKQIQQYLDDISE